MTLWASSGICAENSTGFQSDFPGGMGALIYDVFLSEPVIQSMKRDPIHLLNGSLISHLTSAVTVSRLPRTLFRSNCRLTMARHPGFTGFGER